MYQPGPSTQAPKPKIRRLQQRGKLYFQDYEALENRLDEWMKCCGSMEFGPARALIVPHGNYQHVAGVSASAYKEIEPKKISRIFLIGPAHKFSLFNLSLSPSDEWESPCGTMKIDKKIYEELRETTEFETMTDLSEKNEHGLEAQLPFIDYLMALRKEPWTFVPILVGNLTPDKVRWYGKFLSKYLTDPDNLFIITSNFCHWGAKYDYQYWDKGYGSLSENIRHLDMKAMKTIKEINLQSFITYFRFYGNTICGKFAIQVLIAAVEHLNSLSLEDPSKPRYNFRFLEHYMTSRPQYMHDSSISYVSGCVLEFDSSHDLKPIKDIVTI